MFEKLVSAMIDGVLYKHDPIKSGCKENELLDEYAKIADCITEYWMHGMPLVEATQLVLKNFTGIESISENLKEELQKEDDLIQAIPK